MGQRAAKQQIEKGLKLYNNTKQEQAVRKWKAALGKVGDKKRLRFILLGHLALAYGDWGDYREMLGYSVQQIDIANELDELELRAEAYLNLARANEKLCEYHKAMSYARHSMNNTASQEDPLVGPIHLCLGNANLGFGHFQQALENFDKALKMAIKIGDRGLECNTYGDLAEVYISLKDYDKALRYTVKASELVRCRGQEWSPKLRTVVQLNLATPYRKLGKMDLAMDYCEEAMKMALQLNDRAIQARCLCIFADIHRKRGDCERAYPRYESSLSIAVEAGDRLGQLQVLSGMAKTLVLMKQFQRALDVNTQALDIATSIGNKMSMLRSHWLMHQLYRALGNPKASQQHASAFDGYLRDLSLYCGVCHEVMGSRHDSLNVLTCCHIFHARCAETSSFKARGCPNCKKVLTIPIFV
ncbi:43 kDa receptor-associated protein of the synapse-like [Patiria miniata]|uniref:RING-type domain-containing protein n=1 Tax=Patiria miniata TaxID=46514 RepID=A0A914B8J6_PATMI|nr:43 kDa receptor-associated protein of the synapse-like [Patiria miniata]